MAAPAARKESFLLNASYPTVRREYGLLVVRGLLKSGDFSTALISSGYERTQTGLVLKTLELATTGTPEYTNGRVTFKPAGDSPELKTPRKLTGDFSHIGLFVVRGQPPENHWIVDHGLVKWGVVSPDDAPHARRLVDQNNDIINLVIADPELIKDNRGNYREFAQATRPDDQKAGPAGGLASLGSRFLGWTVYEASKYSGGVNIDLSSKGNPIGSERWLVREGPEYSLAIKIVGQAKPRR